MRSTRPLWRRTRRALPRPRPPAAARRAPLRRSNLHPIDLRRPFRREEAVPHVLEHELARPAARIAETAAATCVDPDHVALVHLQARHDRELLHRAVRANHLRVVWRTFETARHRPRLVDVPCVGAGVEAAVRAHAVLDDDAPAAPVLALAAG